MSVNDSPIRTAVICLVLPLLASKRPRNSEKTRQRVGTSCRAEQTTLGVPTKYSLGLKLGECTLHKPGDAIEPEVLLFMVQLLVRQLFHVRFYASFRLVGTDIVVQAERGRVFFSLSNTDMSILQCISVAFTTLCFNTSAIRDDQ